MLIVGLSACRVFRLRFLVFGAKSEATEAAEEGEWEEAEAEGTVG